MTDTPAIAFQSPELDYSLDPGPYEIESETPREPILCVAEIDAEVRAKFSAVKPKASCNCYHGLTLATVARKHLAEPKPASRSVLMGMAPSTRSDAQAALALIEHGEDRDLTGHTIEGLRAFLDVV